MRSPSRRCSSCGARTRSCERPYRVFGYPLVPLIFLAASVFMVGNALVADPRDTGLTFLIIAAGVPAYWAVAAFCARRLSAPARARPRARIR